MAPVQFGISIPPVFPPRLQVRMAQAFEWMGFDSVWLSDHVLFPDFLPCPEAWSIITAAAMKTRRVVFGTAVSDPHRGHPAVLAQRIATIDRLARGRIILGLGSGESMNLDPFGIPWDRRVRRLQETVAILRGLWDSEEPFSFQGEFFHLENARLCVRPYRGRHLPIYLAALGPLMQRFAGAAADGWIPISLPASHYAEMFAPIRAAAEAAGRDADGIDRMAHVVLALHSDEERVLAMMQDHALGLIWPPVAERAGIPLQPPPEFADTNYITVNPCDPDSLRKFEAHQAWMPREAIRRVVHVGDVARIRRVIGDYVDAGATHIHITNVSLDPAATLSIAGEIVPYFKRQAAPFGVHLANTAANLARRAGLVRQADPRAALAWLRKQS